MNRDDLYQAAGFNNQSSLMLFLGVSAHNVMSKKIETCFVPRNMQKSTITPVSVQVNSIIINEGL